MFTHCQKCNMVTLVEGTEGDLARLLGEWSINFPCIVPKCGGRAKTADIFAVRQHVAAGNTQTIPLEAYYRALHGFGYSPSGTPAAPEEVRRHLLTQRIVYVEAEPVGQPVRTIIKAITLEDGTVLHMEASSRGACVYYVEEENAQSHAGAAEGGPEDRVQAGPTPEQSEAEGGVDGPQPDGLEEPDLSSVRDGHPLCPDKDG